MFFLGGIFGAKTKGGPREASASGRRGIGPGNLFDWVVVIVVSGRLVAMIGASGIVVAAAGRVRECVVGIVYLLEFLGTGRAFGGVGGYTIGVGF